jgi:hypothetical protein
MSAMNRRAHPRYPAWFPINFSVDGGEGLIPGMLCDVSVGGALVWGFCGDEPIERADLHVTFRAESFVVPARVVSIERQWDTAILHMEFDTSAAASPRLVSLIDELQGHFQAYQAYLAHRADDDPALGRTSTQYPPDRGA